MDLTVLRDRLAVQRRQLVMLGVPPGLLNPMPPEVAAVHAAVSASAGASVGAAVRMPASLAVGSPARQAAIARAHAQVDAANGDLAVASAPLMQSIVTLIFLLFLIPGIVFGLVAGTIKTSRDMIAGMTKSMESMGYYLVIMFFIAQFVYAFNTSNLGALMALEGAELLKAMALPWYITIVGIVLLTGFVNIFVGSASGKWGLLAPIFVPMLMTLGISPDLTQAAYRVGDSSTNIITPLMPYFPLVVIYCQRYVKSTGIGTLAAMMLPFSMTFLVLWTVFLLLYAFSGLPLGFVSSLTYPAS